METTTTTTDTGLFLLSVIQDKYNHHKYLADEYEELLSRAKECKACKKELDYHTNQATLLFMIVNKLDLMSDTTYSIELTRNYRVYKAKQNAESDI